MSLCIKQNLEDEMNKLQAIIGAVNTGYHGKIWR
jgi:hypothetical protein